MNQKNIIDEYIESRGTHCPFCKGNMIEGGAVDIENGYALQGMSCLDCNKSWTDIYRLVSIRE